MSYKDIPGYSGFLPLYDAAVDRAPFDRPSVFVEVGVALGHSIAYLAQKVHEAKKPIEIWAVDPWAGKGRNGEQQEALGRRVDGDFELFTRNMLRHAPEELDLVRVVRATSQQGARLFRPASLDLVLIDACHDHDSVAADIKTWRPLLAPGGWLAGDDHEPNYPGVKEACEEAFGAADEGGYDVLGTAWRKVIGDTIRPRVSKLFTAELRQLLEAQGITGDMLDEQIRSFDVVG